MPLSVLSQLITRSAPNFGAGIQKLAVEPYFDDVANLIVGGEQWFEQYKLKLSTLPQRKYSTKNRNLTLRYLSGLCSGEQWRKIDNPRQRGDDAAALYRNAFMEMVEQIDSSIRQIKTLRDFDLDAFTLWLRSRPLPRSGEELQIAWNTLRAPVLSVANRNPKVRLAMSEQDFWDIIAVADIAALESDHEQRAALPIVQRLAMLNESQILSFYNHLANVLYRIDTKSHFEAGPEPLSDDSFLYLRCYVVGKGQQYYEHVLANAAAMPKEYYSFEALLSVAPEAWATVTDDDRINFDINCTEVSFESCSNKDAWKK